MLADSRGEMQELSFLFFSFFIGKGNDNVDVAGDLHPNAGETEAAFLIHLFLLALFDDLCIDEGSQFSLDHCDADSLGKADLRSSQADAVRFLHRLHHVFDQLLHFFGHRRNILRFLSKNRVIFAHEDRQDRHETIMPRVASSSPFFSVHPWSGWNPLLSSSRVLWL